jgi:hypothetical protein
MDVSSSLFTGGAREEFKPTIGLALEGQIIAAPTDVLGFGVYVFANVNPEMSFFGATFGLSLGKLR